MLPHNPAPLGPTPLDIIAPAKGLQERFLSLPRAGPTEAHCPPFSGAARRCAVANDGVALGSESLRVGYHPASWSLDSACPHLAVPRTGFCCSWDAGAVPSDGAAAVAGIA